MESLNNSTKVSHCKKNVIYEVCDHSQGKQNKTPQWMKGTGGGDIVKDKSHQVDRKI